MSAKTQNNNFLLLLAGFLVIALGVMAYVVYYQKPVAQKEITDEQTKMYVQQSDSIDTDSIEKDLMDTSFDGIDKELKDIQIELNTTN